MAWGRQWRGNDADDCTAIIVNNHVAPDQWRDKPDFLSDKLLESKKVPTIIIKDEDLGPLAKWEGSFDIPIFVFHVFYDQAYYISLQTALALINEGVIPPTEQTFYAPGGPTTSKAIYKIWYTLAHPLGTMTRQPEMSAKFIQDKNGHILPYVHFSGGEMALSKEVLTELRSRLR